LSRQRTRFAATDRHGVEERPPNSIERLEKTARKPAGRGLDFEIPLRIWFGMEAGLTIPIRSGTPHWGVRFWRHKHSPAKGESLPAVALRSANASAKSRGRPAPSSSLASNELEHRGEKESWFPGRTRAQREYPDAAPAPRVNR